MYIPIWRCFLSLKRNFPIWLHKILHLRPQETVFKHWTVGGSRTCRMQSLSSIQTVSAVLPHSRYYLITDRMEKSVWSTDLDHGFGKELSSEQLQHGVHDVLPALPQDVAVPMGEVKHCLGGCLCLTVAAKHCRKVFHRLQGQRTHHHTVNRHFDTLYSDSITNTFWLFNYSHYFVCIPHIITFNNLVGVRKSYFFFTYLVMPYMPYRFILQKQCEVTSLSQTPKSFKLTQ